MRWGCGGRFRCASVCYCSRIYSARDSLSLPHHLQEEGGRGEVSCSAYQLIFDKIVLLLVLCLYYSDRIDMTCVDIKKKKEKKERRQGGRELIRTLLSSRPPEVNDDDDNDDDGDGLGLGFLFSSGHQPCNDVIQPSSSSGS